MTSLSHRLLDTARQVSAAYTQAASLAGNHLGDRGSAADAWVVKSTGLAQWYETTSTWKSRGQLRAGGNLVCGRLPLRPSLFTTIFKDEQGVDVRPLSPCLVRSNSWRVHRC